jgi:high-affinity K+ transport system ATPase subunit B
MQEAIAVDQSVDDGTSRRYIDNDDMSEVKADDEKKAAILKANGAKPPKNVNPETGEIIEGETVSDTKAEVGKTEPIGKKNDKPSVEK